MPVTAEIAEKDLPLMALPQKNNPLLRAAFTLLRLFLKSKNSELNMNCGHILEAKEVRGLGSGGRAGAASWDLT